MSIYDNIWEAESGRINEIHTYDRNVSKAMTKSSGDYTRVQSKHTVFTGVKVSQKTSLPQQRSKKTFKTERKGTCSSHN